MKLLPFCVAGLVAADGVPVMPVPITVTCAVEFSVLAKLGVYCTTIVQFDPALTTNPLAQLPPVIANDPCTTPV